MTLVENKHGTGALPKRWDGRDRKYHHVSGLGKAPLPFLWTDGFDIEQKLSNALNSINFRIPPEDQGDSDSCGQNGKRLAEAPTSLRRGSFLRLSGHDLYDHIFYKSGGTTIRDIANWIVKVGIKEESVVPSYFPDGTPPNEQFMEDRTVSDATPNAPLFKEAGYAFPKTDIETIACAIRDNNGCLIQITGWNNFSWRTLFPSAIPGGNSWSHFLYAGKAKLINGKRFIGVLNSWGNIGDNGWQWLSEDFFNGAVTNALVIYDQGLYQYTPPITAKTIGWLTPALQKMIDFFINFTH